MTNAGSKHRTAAAVAWAALALMALGIFWQHRLSVQLAAEVTSARSGQSERERLEEANRRLRARLPSAAELRSLRSAGSALSHLRGKAPAPLPADQAGGPGELAFKPKVFAAAKLKPPEQWTNAGAATPQAAFETWLYAVSHADIDAMQSVLHLSPEAQAKAQEVFDGLPAAQRAEYGSPARMVAMLMTAPGSAPPMAGAQVLGESPAGPDGTTLHTQWQYTDGRIRDNDFPLVDVNGSWQRPISAPTLQKVLQNQPQPNGKPVPGSQ